MGISNEAAFDASFHFISTLSMCEVRGMFSIQGGMDFNWNTPPMLLSKQYVTFYIIEQNKQNMICIDININKDDQ